MSDLHPSWHTVPGGPIGDASVLGKLIDLRVTSGSARVRHSEVTRS